MIGETLEDDDDILGAVVSIKRGQDRLSVWTKTASNEALQMRIAKRVKMTLDLPAEVKLDYKGNAAMISAGGRMSSAGESCQYSL